MRHATAVGLTLILLGCLSAEDLARRTWVVDGVTREALVSVPATVPATGVALIFAFHGHGGSMTQVSRSFSIHEHWPEAIVVYPQGLPTPGQLTDGEGTKAGWQGKVEMQDDRDLRFFDTMLTELRQRHVIDARRIYSTGHSNGGGFTYLLWAERGEVFAAVAPSAAVLGRGSRTLTPKPMLHVASPQDNLVKFAWQERMLMRVLALNDCGEVKPGAMGYTVYPSRTGNDVGIYLHPGGHRYPSDTAPRLIVKFFQTHPGH